MAKEICIGIDIGGTKIAIGLVDKKGKVIDEVVFPTHPTKEYEIVKNDLISHIKSILKKKKHSVSGIGVGIAGQIDTENGNVIFAPNLFWNDVPLQKDLQKAFKDLSIVLVNDVRAATIGEWLFGAGKKSDNFACLFIGTGIGGGIVSHGELLTGVSNTAGEFGHMPINFNGRQCTCGAHGCLESYAGGWAIAKRAKDLIEEDKKFGHLIIKLADGKIENITAKHVVEAFFEGDPLAKLIMDEVTEALILGVTAIVHAFNPERLIMAGGVILGLPDLIEWVEEGVKARGLKAATSHLKILPALLKENAGIIGAAALACAK